MDDDKNNVVNITDDFSGLTNIKATTSKKRDPFATKKIDAWNQSFDRRIESNKERGDHSNDSDSRF